jgi:hypothetical protein
MPQHDLDVGPGSGIAVRTDLNAALAALGSTMKGPNAPPAPVAGMVWVEDDNPSSTRWTVRMYDGADWIVMGTLDATANTFEPWASATLGARAGWVDIASAGTTDIGAAGGQAVRITGTTTITSFGTVADGVTRKLRFAGSLTLTHNASSLILPCGANITTAAGDTADAVSLGAGNWLVTQYTPATTAGMRSLAGIRAAPQIVAEAAANNSASLDITTGLDDTFDCYELEILSLVPASNDVSLALRVGTGAGPTWQAGVGAYETQAAWATNATLVFLGGAATGVFLSAAAGGNNSVGNQTGASISGVVEIVNPEAALFPALSFRTRYMRPTGSGGASVTGAGVYLTSGAITGLRVLFSSGNIVSGSVRLIGYRKG